MRKGHLKLVYSNEIEQVKTSDFNTFFRDIHNDFKCLFTSKKEKIYFLKDQLIKLYRDYENTTGICDIPYYMRAELKISEIIQTGRIDYYFKMFEKIRKKTMLSKL